MTATISKVTKLILATAALSAVCAAPAHAQSTEEVLGALIGGSAGAALGNELGSGGDIIGGLVGGSLGYYVGDQINDRNRYKGQYTQQRAYNQGYQAASDYQQYGGRVVYQSPRTVTQPYYHTSQPTYRAPRHYTAPQPVYRSHPRRSYSQGSYVQTHQPTTYYRR